MAATKKFKVLKAVDYGTFTEKAENGRILKSDIRRYEPGESIEPDPKDIKDMFANGIIGDFDAAPKDEPKEEKPEEKKGGK